MIIKVLWGIWFFRNKKVWEGKSVTPQLTVDWSSKFFADWRVARLARLKVKAPNTVPVINKQTRWMPPAEGCVKLNVDASIYMGSDSFSTGMVLRNHLGEFC